MPVYTATTARGQRLDAVVRRAAVTLGAPPPERADGPVHATPTGLLVAVPSPGVDAVWECILGAECPALVHLGVEMPGIERWAAGLQGERDHRPDPQIWPWGDPGARAQTRAMCWWVEARVRRPPSGPPWHRVTFIGRGTAWVFLWRDEPGGAAALAAARHAADLVVTEWIEQSRVPLDIRDDRA